MIREVGRLQESQRTCPRPQSVDGALCKDRWVPIFDVGVSQTSSGSTNMASLSEYYVPSLLPFLIIRRYMQRIRTMTAG